MKYDRKNWYQKSGIYGIRNILNNKIYIGKASCIYSRLKDHTTRLNNKSKDENIHLLRSWHKYSQEVFEYFVIEYCSINKLAERELYWMKCYDVISTKGYNLRLDTSTKCIVSDETRERLSKAQKKRWKNASKEELEKVAKETSEFWANNPDKKEKMSQRVAKTKSKYKFYQLDMNGNHIKTWNSIMEIREEYPDYHDISIYSVCNGHKNSYRGYKWKKELKI